MSYDRLTRHKHIGHFGATSSVSGVDVRRHHSFVSFAVFVGRSWCVVNSIGWLSTGKIACTILYKHIESGCRMCEKVSNNKKQCGIGRCASNSVMVRVYFVILFALADLDYSRPHHRRWCKMKRQNQLMLMRFKMNFIVSRLILYCIQLHSFNVFLERCLCVFMAYPIWMVMMSWRAV